MTQGSCLSSSPLFSLMASASGLDTLGASSAFWGTSSSSPSHIETQMVFATPRTELDGAKTKGQPKGFRQGRHDTVVPDPRSLH